MKSGRTEDISAWQVESIDPAPLRKNSYIKLARASGRSLLSFAEPEGTRGSRPFSGWVFPISHTLEGNVFGLVN